MEGEGAVCLRCLVALALQKFVAGGGGSWRSNVMEAVDLVGQLVGDVAFEDLGAHRPEDLACKPGVGGAGVGCADALTAELVCEICQAGLLPECVQDG